MERITLVYFILVLCVSYGYSQRLQSPCPDVFSYESDGYKYYGRIVIRNTFSASQIKLDVHFSVAGPANGGGSLELQNSNNALSSFNRGTPMQYVLSFPEARSIPSITAIIVNGQRICAGPGLRRNQYIINFSLSHTAYLSGSQYGYNPQPEPPMYPNNYETETIEPVYSPPTYPETYQDPGRLPNNNNYGYDTGVIQTPRPVIQTWVQPTTTQAPQQLYSQGPTTHRQSESSVGCGTVSSKITLIYEGQDFKKGEIPWLAAIFKKSKGSLMFICGGTLVSNRHIVTAAHCVHTSYKQLLVRLGVQGLYESFDRDTAPKGLIDAAVHPDYNNHSNYENDIAVLTLKERLSFNDYVRPACLWTGDTSQELIVGMTGTVAGWGDQSRRGGAAEIPKRISLPIVSTTRCRDSSVYLQDYTSQTSFCAGERDGSGPCSGDSGGGLYIYQGDKWRLRGIVSVSVGDQERLCNLREYVVFTDAAQFIPWIRSIINKDYYD